MLIMVIKSLTVNILQIRVSVLLVCMRIPRRVQQFRKNALLLRNVSRFFIDIHRRQLRFWALIIYLVVGLTHVGLQEKVCNAKLTKYQG